MYVLFLKYYLLSLYLLICCMSIILYAIEFPKGYNFIPPLPVYNCRLCNHKRLLDRFQFGLWLLLLEVIRNHRILNQVICSHQALCIVYVLH